MFGLQFDRPVNAAADQKELEFIIALHQTSNETRKNATVSSVDIQAFLKSRYSLDISESEAIEIVRGLSGGQCSVEEAFDSQQRKDGTPISMETSRRIFESLWKKTLSRLKHPFQHPSSSQSIDDEPHVTTESPDAENNGNTEFSPSQSLTGDLETLLRLTIAQQQGLIGGDLVNELQDKIEDDLKDKILDTTERTSNNIAEHPKEESLFESGGGQEGDSQEDSTQARSTKEDLPTPKEFQSTSDPIHPEGDDPPLAEYLDMVQILSCIMLPTIARIAGEAKAVGQSMSSDEDNKNPVDPFLRLICRFRDYGRRTLKIQTSLTKFPFVADEVLEISQRALLKDLDGVPEERRHTVDEQFVQYLLLKHGEVERAMDSQLVNEMVAAAHSISGTFDREALLNAISGDLDLWDPSNDTQRTTFFHDVYGQDLPGKKVSARGSSSQADDDNKNTDSDVELSISTKDNDLPRQDSSNEVEKQSSEPQKPDFNTAWNGLDLVNDTQLSILINISTWTFFIAM